MEGRASSTKQSEKEPHVFFSHVNAVEFHNKRFCYIADFNVFNESSISILIVVYQHFAYKEK